MKILKEAVPCYERSKKMDQHNQHGAGMHGNFGARDLGGRYAHSKASEKVPAAPSISQEGAKVRGVQTGEAIRSEAAA